MPRYLDTLGNDHLSIAICDRCHLKRPYDALGPDPNSPGLRVCQDKSGCKDQFDPWRLPGPPPDRVTVRQPRPDNDIATTAAEAAAYIYPLPPD